MEILDQYKKHIISVKATAREALQLLDLIPETESRTLFVLNGKKLEGTLTDGDIRRGLLKDKEISDDVSQYMNQTYKSLLKNEANPDVMTKFRKQEVWLLPILNSNSEIEEIIDLKTIRTVIPAAALIMAGGRGERLRPLTDTLPKPMLIVGNKPIIEINIDRLISFGIKHFYISVRYLSEKIIDYLGDGSSKNVIIKYLREEEPLGTLGACSLIDDLEYNQLLVMNSDILTNINFEDFYSYFKSRQAVMCTASIPYNVQVPYGIMQLDGADFVTALIEKPTYTYYANAGIYFLQKDILTLIPNGVVFNATDLMDQLIKTRQKLVQYPILQYWLDIGKYDDYIRAQQDFSRINF